MILVWGAWRRLKDKAKGYFHVQTSHRQDCPALGSYRKVGEATDRYSIEMRALLALILQRHRQAQGPSPIVLQDSIALAVGPQDASGATPHLACLGTGI